MIGKLIYAVGLNNISRRERIYVSDIKTDRQNCHRVQSGPKITHTVKALDAFLMIQRQMTLKVYNVRKLHRPRMSDGFLILSCTTAVMFSELHDQLAGLERHATLARCLSAVTELLVNKDSQNALLRRLTLYKTHTSRHSA